MTEPINPQQKLPIGIQTFRKIREANYYYVDQTALALKLIDEGTYYFLSRPRRFGKSLLIDTLAELFSGNQSLFKGLYADKNWNWSRKSPVIRFSFGGGTVRSQAELDLKIQEQLSINQQALGLTCQQTTSSACFAELIRKTMLPLENGLLFWSMNTTSLILDNIENSETAKVMREGLRSLYSIIKDMDAHIRFTLLIGVSTFSKVSLFSGLNNLNDITVDPVYSSICGYTDKDIDTIFQAELEGLDRQKISQTFYISLHIALSATEAPFNRLQPCRKLWPE